MHKQQARLPLQLCMLLNTDKSMLLLKLIKRDLLKEKSDRYVD